MLEHDRVAAVSKAPLPFYVGLRNKASHEVLKALLMAYPAA
eukprot:SAG31_NODE_39524_length_287_cov_1.122340_1_plen_40_part_01